MKESELDRLLVINQVKDRVLTQSEAGARLGLSQRQVRRLSRRFQIEGPQGIKSKHKGGNRLFSKEFKEEILKIVREKYKDFGPKFASEKLEQEEGLKINKETLRQWMMVDGLWKGRLRCTPFTRTKVSIIIGESPSLNCHFLSKHHYLLLGLWNCVKT